METGLIIGLSVEFGVCILCIVLGLILWKKQKISMVHDYQHENVKTEDIPAYTRLIGIGLIIIGVGIGLMGVANLVDQIGLGFIAMGLGFVIGILIMHKAQKKYNGSWFS